MLLSIVSSGVSTMEKVFVQKDLMVHLPIAGRICEMIVHFLIKT